MPQAFFTPNYSGFSNHISITKKAAHIGLLISWLGIRDGNITFQDSLDFDLSEIDSVYEDNLENQ